MCLLLQLIEGTRSEGIRTDQTSSESLPLIMHSQLPDGNPTISIIRTQAIATYLCTCRCFTGSLDTDGHEHI